MRLLLVGVVILALLTPLAMGEVTELIVSPENPVVGDILNLAVIASPYEEVPISIRFTRNLAVTNGMYLLDMSQVSIPTLPNNFKIRARGVKDLTVALKIFGWISYDTDAENGVATISQGGIPPGKYDVKIFGYALDGVDKVQLEVIAETTLTADDNGRIEYDYPTKGIPPGTFTANVGGLIRSLTLSPEDNSPPKITSYTPGSIATVPSPMISANFSDTSGVDVDQITLFVDGLDVSNLAEKTENWIVYQPPPMANNTQHTVTLTVSDTRGNSKTKSWGFSILIPPPQDQVPPTITTKTPTGKVVSEEVEIQASYVDNRKVDLSTLRIFLNEEDYTSQAQVSENSLKLVVRNLVNSTVYHVRLVIGDKAGNTIEEEWEFETFFSPSSQASLPPQNKPPIPVIRAQESILVSKPIVFDATDSYDPDGAIIEYVWNLGDGNKKTGPRITHQYSAEGSYDVTLTVKDNKGEIRSVVHRIEVLDSAYWPVARAGRKRHVYVGFPITFDASNSESRLGEIVKYIWNFGDGSHSEGVVAKHVFMSPGVYNVRLTIIDTMGRVGNDNVKVVVEELQEAIRELQVLPVARGAKQLRIRNTTLINVHSNTNTTIVFIEFEENPHPEVEAPPGLKGVIDIMVENPSAIKWPIYVERKINQTKNTPYLGFYFYANSSWYKCSETGVNLVLGTVWANLSRRELWGNPLAIAHIIQPPTLNISNLKVWDRQIRKGEPFQISFTATNTGDSPSSFNLTVLTDQDPFVTQNITLNSGESKEIEYWIIIPQAGEHTIQVANSSLQIEVLETRANLTINRVHIPDVLYEDTPFNLNVEICNKGTYPSTETHLTVLLGETILAQIIVPPLQGNKTQNTTLTLALPQGEHELTLMVGDQSESATRINIFVVNQRKPIYPVIFIGAVLLASMAYIAKNYLKVNLRLYRKV